MDVQNLSSRHTEEDMMKRDGPNHSPDDDGLREQMSYSILQTNRVKKFQKDFLLFIIGSRDDSLLALDVDLWSPVAISATPVDVSWHAQSCFILQTERGKGNDFLLTGLMDKGRRLDGNSVAMAMLE